MSKHSVRLKRGAAYIGVPLLFCCILYFVLYVTLQPLLSPYLGLADMFISSGETPQTGTEQIGSIFVGAPEQDEATVDGSTVEIPYYGAHYAQLTLDRIGLRTDVYMGDSSAILKKGTGQYYGSMPFGFGRPILLSGHNNREMNLLQYVEEGDIFVAETNYGTYQYQVNKIEIISKDAFSTKILRQDKEQLIVYTCYPFEYLGVWQYRLFIYADKISGPAVVFD